MKAGLFLFLLVISCRVLSQEQKPAFPDEIQAFRKQDSSSFPGTNKILFVGSSSFAIWQELIEPNLLKQ